MNCDDAFDALTDPVGADTAELAEHLAVCPRCRELKQVLEPALSLLCGDLPAEPARPATLPQEGRGKDHAVTSQTSFLSVDAIRVAEAAAARLASLNALSGGRPAVRLSKKRVSRRVLQGVLCAAFGGLVVFCVGLWGRKADVAPQPSIVPSVRPAGVCTRNTVPKTRENARAVILSCVACHLQDHRPRSEQLPTSLFRSTRRTADRVLLACCQTKVVNDNGPMPTAEYLAGGRRLGLGSA
jgi:hypothetical protein